LSGPIVNLIYAKLTDAHFMLSLLVAIATMATIITIAMPLVEKDALSQRMKAVATERERIRARERERLMAEKGKRVLRQEHKAYMKQSQMTMAGFRGPQAEVAFLFFRLVTPILSSAVCTIYLLAAPPVQLSASLKAGAILFATYVGLKAPELYLSNAISKRQHSMGRAFPDALDLLLICVESGMSIEHAPRKVAQEIGIQSVALAEELSLTTAELSFLPERRSAFENLGIRTGLDSIKQIVTVLIQAERYGTPLGAALRTVAQESRNQRMMLAEKKAAALPPKLTVPMILFFLPVLFVIIMTPAIIQISRTVAY
jgi:tight adherence protein C